VPVEILRQVVSNLRANKLRSFLTMFGILWGVISVVILSATGEGFRRGNEKVLQELGKNIAIVWGARTGMQAGGERAGRDIRLTVNDVHALQTQSDMIRVVSAEINHGGVIKSRYNSSTSNVDGIEPQYQAIRSIDVDRGRTFSDADEAEARRVAILGSDSTTQLFGNHDSIGETIQVSGIPFTVIGRIRKKDQDSDYNGRDNDKVFIPFSAMARDFPRADVPDGVLSQIIVAPREGVVDRLPEILDSRTGRIEDIDWPLEREIRRVIAQEHGFDPADRDAVRVWDTSLESIMFGRMIQTMKNFFTVVGLVTLSLGGLGVMNIMLVAVRERTREIGIRKALGATPGQIQRQFFLEGFILTLLSGTLGFLLALGLCALVNLAPMPTRFEGMILTWQAGLGAVAALVFVGVVSSTYPARRAAMLPPVEALRFES
jgi:putative ABC transport system permease protein